MKKILLLFILFTMPLFPSEKNRGLSQIFRAGVGGSYNLPVGTSNFKEIPGVSNCCNEFNKNSGNEMSFYIFAEKDIFKDLSIQLRAGYRKIAYKFATDEFIGYAEYNKVPSPIDVNYSLSTEISTYTISPGMAYQPVESIPLKFMASFNMEFTGESNYSQTEVLSASAVSKGFIFEDSKSSSRNVSTGIIKDINSMFSGITVGVGYEYLFNNNFALQPEIRYSQYFGQAIKNMEGTFSINNLSIGANLIYSIYKDNRIKEEKTVEPPKNPPLAKLPKLPKPDEPKTNDLGKDMNIDCFYLEFKICETKEEAEIILNKVLSLNFKEALIDKSYSELLEKDFYIVKSNCNDYDTIHKLREVFLDTKVFEEIKISFIRKSK